MWVEPAISIFEKLARDLSCGDGQAWVKKSPPLKRAFSTKCDFLQIIRLLQLLAATRASS